LVFIHYLRSMNIGFDAKRAYHNGTGLGHYSRTLIQSLSSFFPENEYFLFNPKPATLFKPEAANIHEVRPSRFLSKLFRSAWRSSWVTSDLKKNNIHLYHGLSHEIPAGIQKTGIPSVVTMHDLIFERYPEQYSKIDVQIYRKKFRYAAAHADKVIAISQQTKADLIEFYNTPEHKIEICYQSCNPSFAQKIASDEKKRIRQFYGLPDKFFLYVGSIIERKNLLTICKAMRILNSENSLPLVVIGNGGSYKQKVQEYIKKEGLEERIIFLSDTEAARNTTSFRTAADFPAIYQSATALIYPSFFEGFGIPVLEALWSRVPVITSNVSCMPETGGDAACYINPESEEEMAAAMQEVANNQELRIEMIDRGWQHAHQFTNEKCAASVMMVYNDLMKNKNSK
jgi:glycosyltransferase involved in cell wall biosynthesis